MANNTVRTIMIFSLITLVLGGTAVGAVRLMKARNSSYAAQAQPTATNTPQQTPDAEQKKEEVKKEETPQTQPNSNPQSAPSPATQTPPPSTPTPQPATTPAPADTGATPNGSMPATGPTDFLVTVGLLMLAVFFGMKLLRARADYRRYVGS